MNPSQRLTCLQCLDHPYLADLARKDPRWQAQRKQLQASVAAAAGAATGSIRCDSNTSSATHVDDSACSSGLTADARPGSLPSAVSPGSIQQGAFKQGPGAVPRLQLQQQPGIKAFPASNLGGGGTSSTSQSTTVTPRSSVGHAAGVPASKQRQQQQHVQLQSLGSSKHLAAPKAQPVIKKQPSKGHTSQAATQAAANAGSRGMPSLSLGPTKPGQLQVDTTPRGVRAPAAAASPAAAFGAPITRAKAASMAAVSQAYGQPAPGAAAAAAAAGAAGAGDVDMSEGDSPATSMRRKRLASGGAAGGTSLRNGSRQGEGDAEEQCSTQQGPRSPMVTLPPAGGSGAAGVRRQQGPAVSSQQQQWGGGPGRHAGGYAPSNMEVDVCTGVGSKNSSRPQSPLTRTSATGGTGPYSLTAPVWRDASCDAGPAPQHQHQQQQGLKPAPGGSSRWGAGLGVSGGMGSPQAASPGGSRGLVKGSAWAQADGGSAHMLQHSSFGVAATGIGSSWSDDAATAAGATLGLQSGGLVGPGSSISTRSSLAASALPVFADALCGLQAHGGGHAPVSSSPASGGLFGRGSMVGPQAGVGGSSGSAGPGSKFPAAPGLQLEEARASLAAGGGHQQQQQQQYSPSHQPYLYQHLYH